jgi:hypothetical protein
VELAEDIKRYRFHPIFDKDEDPATDLLIRRRGLCEK